MSDALKITTSELVLSAIFFLQKKNGVSSRDITKFICEKRGCKQSHVKEEVKKALEKATKMGIFEKKRGLYRIKSTFGKNIISENIRKLEKNEKDSNSNLEETPQLTECDAHRTSLDRKIFGAELFVRKNALQKHPEFNTTETFQNLLYIPENEDDFENESGENISVERLRVCRSDDDDFLEEDEYDDDEIDFFADEQFPIPEGGLKTGKDSASENSDEIMTPSKCEDQNNVSEDQTSKKKQAHSKTPKKYIKGFEKPSRTNKRILKDSEDEYDNKNVDQVCHQVKIEAKQNEKKEKQQSKEQRTDANQSMNTENRENAMKKANREGERNEREKCFIKTTLKTQKLQLNCENQKLYNNKYAGNNKNEDAKRNITSNVKPNINIKVESNKPGECANVNTTLHEPGAQEVLSEPENREKKTKRDRSSSLFRASKKNTSFKRKHMSDCKPVKHRKFN